MMKTKLLKIAVIILITLIIGASVFLIIHNKSSIERTQPFPANNRSNDTPISSELEMELLAYVHSINKFIQVSVNDVKYKIDNCDTFILYIGRSTCQWCRKLAPVLSSIIAEKGVKLYYLDSEDTEIDPTIAEFRTAYKIETVPAIVLFDQEEYRLLDFDIVNSDFDSLKECIEVELEAMIASES